MLRPPSGWARAVPGRRRSGSRSGARAWALRARGSGPACAAPGRRGPRGKRSCPASRGRAPAGRPPASGRRGRRAGAPRRCSGPPWPGGRPGARASSGSRPSGRSARRRGRGRARACLRPWPGWPAPLPPRRCPRARAGSARRAPGRGGASGPGPRRPGSRSPASRRGRWPPRSRCAGPPTMEISPKKAPSESSATSKAPPVRSLDRDPGAAAGEDEEAPALVALAHHGGAGIEVAAAEAGKLLAQLVVVEPVEERRGQVVEPRPFLGRDGEVGGQLADVGEERPLAAVALGDRHLRDVGDARLAGHLGHEDLGRGIAIHARPRRRRRWWPPRRRARPPLRRPTGPPCAGSGAPWRARRGRRHRSRRRRLRDRPAARGRPLSRAPAQAGLALGAPPPPRRRPCAAPPRRRPGASRPRPAGSGPSFSACCRISRRARRDSRGVQLAGEAEKHGNGLVGLVRPGEDVGVLEPQPDAAVPLLELGPQLLEGLAVLLPGHEVGDALGGSGFREPVEGHGWAPNEPRCVPGPGGPRFQQVKCLGLNRLSRRPSEPGDPGLGVSCPLSCQKLASRILREPSMVETRPPLFTRRFFTMCGFTFTVFLSAFQLLPVAPFHILELGRQHLRRRALPRLPDLLLRALGAVHGRPRRPLRASASCCSCARSSSRASWPSTPWSPATGSCSPSSSRRGLLVGTALRVLRLHDRLHPGDPPRRGHRLLGDVHHARGGDGAQRRVLLPCPWMGGRLHRDRAAQPGHGGDRLEPARGARTRTPRRRASPSASGASWSGGWWRSR